MYLKGVDYERLRKYIKENSKSIEINDLGDNIFTDVQMPTAIIKICKDKRKSIMGDFAFWESNPIIDK